MNNHTPPRKPEAPGIARFGEAQWESGARRLTIRGEPVKLTWRVAECLGMLVEAAGEVVTKDDLRQQIWGGALLEESNVAQCVTALRKILDPAPEGGSYIETVTRVGYRMAVPVVFEEVTPMQMAVPAAPNPEVRRVPLVRAIWASVALLALLAGGLEAFKRMEQQERAKELAVRGFSLLRRGNLEDARRATPLFREALELEPRYPLALSGLAESAARLGEVWFEAAASLAREAAANDPDCGECQAVFGYILMSRAWKWEEAGRYLKRSIELEPGQAQRRLWYTHWLASQNRLAEAEVQANAAIQLDRSEPVGYSTLAAVKYLSGRYQEAIQAAASATSLNSYHQPGHYWTYRAHLQLGRDTDAIIAKAREAGAWGKRTAEQNIAESRRFEAIHGQSGRIGVARAWLDDVKDGKPRDVHRYNRALWHMWIGEHAEAISELEAAVKSRPYHIMYVAADPAFAPLRDNPRFQQVVQAVGLRQ